MNRAIESKHSSSITGRINAARMTESDRQHAINAMERAEMIVDGFVWVANKIEQLRERLFLKPQLKH
jgi:hypothetical protein